MIDDDTTMNKEVLGVLRSTTDTRDSGSTVLNERLLPFPLTFSPVSRVVQNTPSTQSIRSTPYTSI